MCIAQGTFLNIFTFLPTHQFYFYCYKFKGKNLLDGITLNEKQTAQTKDLLPRSLGRSAAY